VSPRTSKALPTIEPVVPIPGSPPMHDPQWIYEPKFDGFRGVLTRRATWYHPELSADLPVRFLNERLGRLEIRRSLNGDL
jgi:hypothetical protein